MCRCKRILMASFTVYGILNTIHSPKPPKIDNTTTAAWVARKIYVILIEVQFTLLSVITSFKDYEII